MHTCHADCVQGVALSVPFNSWNIFNRSRSQFITEVNFGTARVGYLTPQGKHKIFLSASAYLTSATALGAASMTSGTTPCFSIFFATAEKQRVNWLNVFLDSNFSAIMLHTRWQKTELLHRIVL